VRLYELANKKFMGVKDFENNRWKNNEQISVFRHMAALDMIDKGDVLDLGCGDGLFLDMLRNKDINGIGLDLSEEAIKKCQSRGLDARLFDLENYPWPFADNQFKYTVCLDNLEHVFNPEKILNEAKRLAEKIIIGVPNFNSLPARLQAFFGKVPENNRPNKGHVYWFNYEVLKEIVQNNNLRIAEIKTNTFWENKLFWGLLLKYL
jgi:methionine biosynthesis protein MetW